MIKVLNYTKNPLTLIGTCAKECWNSNPKNLANTANECIESAHGRVLEFADVTVVIDGYSARAVRELYTHVIGTTRLQSSTRYIKYGEFDYFTPPSIPMNGNEDALYHTVMKDISEGYKKLLDAGIPKEDVANILPLGMVSKVVLKINARAILHLAEMRLCARAYHEIRDLARELISAVTGLDEEWARIMGFAKVRCEVNGYCPEKNSCGRFKTQKQIANDKIDIKNIAEDLAIQLEKDSLDYEDLEHLLCLLLLK